MSKSLLPELLAPAGEPASAVAAFRRGADAVYLGLAAFSARAEAVNFTPEQLAVIVGRARAVPPGTPTRRVYVAVNTLVADDELAGALETVARAAESGADALIIQDLGLAALAARHFPGIDRHASTQLAVHNAEGARTAARWGFRRVTLAREMTLAEIREAAAAAREHDATVEVFVHGALCYGYSGLCLAGGVLAGRSGNRGRCPYPCRSFCRRVPTAEAAGATGATEEDPNAACRDGHPFSLRDMARWERLRELADAGVASLKIEGRKKSPLYVAAAVALHRAALDSCGRNEASTPERGPTVDGLSTVGFRLSEPPSVRGPKVESRKSKAGQRPADSEAPPPIGPTPFREMAADLQTVFARPWTDFFLDGDRQADAGDPDVVGHRGAPCGTVVEVRGARGLRGDAAGTTGLVFDSARALERHDGLQFEVAGVERPAGFAVDEMRLVHDHYDERVFETPAGARIWVALPPGQSPPPLGTMVYAAASQAVKRRFAAKGDDDKGAREPFRLPLTVRVILDRAAVRAQVRLDPFPAAPGRSLDFTLDFPPATDRAVDAAATDAAGRKAFARLGETPFRLAGWTCENPDGLFLPPARWNALRREVAARAAESLEENRRRQIAAALRELPATPAQPVNADTVTTEISAPTSAPRWSVYVDFPRYLAAFAADDWRDVDEIVVAIDAVDPEDNDPGARLSPALWADRLLTFAADAAARASDGEGGGGGGEGGPPVLRVALPTVMRARTRRRVRERFDALRAAGCRRWLLGNLWGWDWLHPVGGAREGEVDWAADWSLYAANRAAAGFLAARGATRYTLSPEDSPAAWRDWPAAPGPPRPWVVVDGDIPLFQGAVCAHHTLARAAAGRCPFGDGADGGSCRARPMPLRMAGGTDILVLPQRCGTVALPMRPRSLAGSLGTLRRMGLCDWRVDFRWRPHLPDEVLSRWRSLRAGAQAPSEFFGR